MGAHDKAGGALGLRVAAVALAVALIVTASTLALASWYPGGTADREDPPVVDGDRAGRAPTVPPTAGRRFLAGPRLPAFPGAEGFGAGAVGGRGGEVVTVTNLLDQGPGSFRACAEASGPRTCVFRLGGTIELQSQVTINDPYLTIAGQTAPGEGITLRSSPDYTRATLKIQTHDVIIRGLRVRTGPSEEESSMRRGITIEAGARRVIIDRCSISWATDDNITLIDGVRDVTIQWSIIAEALSYSTHSEGEHSKGLAISGKQYESEERTGRISVHHNLFAHNRHRNPRHAAFGLVDMVNNVVYNWGGGATEVNDAQSRPALNVLGNYYRAGPDTSGLQPVEITVDDGHGAAVYLKGNIGPPGEDLVDPDQGEWLVAVPHPAAPVTVTSAERAYREVMARAGAGVRDAVDARILGQVRRGEGRIIDDPEQVGGWPDLRSGVVPADSDGDGMPDDWETARGLDPERDDGAGDRDRDGYTNLEEYLNGLVG